MVDDEDYIRPSSRFTSRFAPERAKAWKSAYLEAEARSKLEGIVDTYKQTKQTTDRTNTMFNLDSFNMGNMFHGMFGKIDKGLCAMSMSGGIAIKTSNGYKTYNVAKKRLTNVTNLCFDASDLFFVMPTSKVQIGDVILVAGKPKCVIGINDESIKCIDYENSEIREIVPERHVFMGSTYFYGKIVSLFGGAGLKGKGLMGKLLQLMVMKNLMGGSGSSDSMGGLGQMMMMQQLFGGMGGAGTGVDFANMFNLDFGSDASWADDSDETDEDDGEDEAEEAPAPKKKRAKKADK